MGGGPFTEEEIRKLREEEHNEQRNRNESKTEN
jgi:hypothetical protein